MKNEKAVKTRNPIKKNKELNWNIGNQKPILLPILTTNDNEDLDWINPDFFEGSFIQKFNSYSTKFVYNSAAETYFLYIRKENVGRTPQEGKKDTANYFDFSAMETNELLPWLIELLQEIDDAGFLETIQKLKSKTGKMDDPWLEDFWSETGLTVQHGRTKLREW